MNRIEELDKVLKYFYTKEPEFIGTGLATIIKTEDFTKLTGTDLSAIILKLERDGYIFDIAINSDGSGGQGLISFEGGIFVESGGYKEKIKESKVETNRQKLMNVITAIGTGFAGLYGLWEILKAILHHFSCC